MKSAPHKRAFGATKLPAFRWHDRLGHPSLPVVQQILSKNKIPFISDSNKETICDACQQGKSHQLPYPKSVSVSNNPLDLVFSDVWVLLQPRLEETIIMLVSLMISANLLGFISFDTNLKFYSVFTTFKILLNAYLIRKLLLCKLIGVGSINV